MAGGVTEPGAEYSPTCGLIFVFNLIVGTGALAMPLTFYQAGWLVSIIVVIVLAIMSYVSATFMVETMATANMKLRMKRKNMMPVNTADDDNDDDVYTLLLPHRSTENEEVYSISERVEMGSMASLFFNKYGVLAFYISIIIYLYGDLSIYCVAIPKSIRDAMCTYKGNNLTKLDNDDQCWQGVDISRLNAYRLAIAFMALLLSGFVFTDVQKSKYLQGFTTVIRWLGLLLMITIAVMVLSSGKGTGTPPLANLSGIPNLFGACVYSFMCHHSLPSIITPINNKSRLNFLLGIDFIAILFFYSLLSFTAIFTTDQLQDLYTLNFLPDNSGNGTHVEPLTNIVTFQYFLALFPVLTLGSNFPIIGITLRNNLKVLFANELRPYPWIVDKVVFPLVTIIPPFIVAMVTMDVAFLVGITGSYAGSVIQYVIPATLVYFARKEAMRVMGTEVRNKHTSFFRSSLWVWFIVGWSVVCVGFVTVNHVLNR